MLKQKCKIVWYRQLVIAEMKRHGIGLSRTTREEIDRVAKEWMQRIPYPAPYYG